MLFKLKNADPSLVIESARSREFILNPIVVDHIDRWEEVVALDRLHSQVHAVIVGQKVSVLCGKAVNRCCVEESR